MRNAVYIFFIAILITLTSCRKDFDTVPSSGGLEFSSQTVYLDTIFTGISSSTYMLKVYNRSNKDISIPSIRLGKSDSKFRLMLDGMTGKDDDNSGQGDGKFFPNVEILAKDSLFVFIEATTDISDAGPDLTYNDQILFDSGANQQAVNLVTLVQDAVFIVPNRELVTNVLETFQLNADSGPIQGHTLTSDAELHWTSARPYVVYGYAYVPPGKTLVIDAGTNVHFHADSGIMVGDGGKIEINGDFSDYDADGNILVNREVTFEGDRLEPRFEETPGQWGTILITSGNAIENTVNHLTLKNAAVGLFIQASAENTQPKLKISNSKIYNSSIAGILSRQGDVTGENLVINLAGQASLACSLGGSYSFTHCTFNNNWPSSSQVAVSVDNYLETQTGNVVAALTKADFLNCIIYGSNQVEMLLNQDASAPFVYRFDSCLIKFNDANTTISDDENYGFIRNPTSANGNNIKSVDPLFRNPSRNNLNIGENSPAIQKGNAAYDDALPFDINHNPRPGLSPGKPDIGAYQYNPF